MRFSVVIPVYNVAPYLTACLDSVAAAVRRLGEADAAVETEVLCVDDGSTDASGRILDAYASSSFRVIRQTNAGVAAARNRALEAATGDWILFVDGDDFVRDTWLTDILGILRRHPSADLVGFEKMVYYGTEDWGSDPVAETDVGVAETIADVLSRYSVYQCVCSAALVKGLRFPRLTVGEDLVYVAEALARSRHCLVTKRREYGYRYRPESASHEAVSAAKMRDVIAFNRAMFAILSRSGKRLGEAFTHGRAREWLASVPRIILAHRGDPAWREVWELWLDSMADFAALPCFPERQRHHARCVASSRSVWQARLHCLWPAWLRRKGLARWA